VRLWNRFFFEPRSVAPAALARIGWGSLVVAWTLTLLPDIDPFLTDGAMRYDRPLPPWAWNPLDWIGWTTAPLVACLLLVAAGVAVALGWRTHLSLLVALVCLTSLQRTNPTILNSGDLLIRQFGFALLLSPAGRALSLDERRRTGTFGRRPPARRAPFGMRLLQLWVGTGYLFSAILKLQGQSWGDGTAVGYALRIEDLSRFDTPEWIFDHPWLVNGLTWGTLALEVLFLFLVWNRRLRPWVIGAGVAFHVGIDLFLDVGFFSTAVFIAYLAWLPDERADRIVGRLQDLLARLSGRGSAGGSARSVGGSVGTATLEPLTVEPAEQDRHGSGVVAEPVSGALDDP
jgi:hypothetical protein